MTRPDQISTFDHTAADGLVWRSCVISKSLRMRRLVCAFAVRKTPQDSFLTSRPILCFLNIKKFSTQVLMYSIQNTRLVDKHVLHLEMKSLFSWFQLVEHAYSNLNYLCNINEIGYPLRPLSFVLFVWFDSLRPINNLSVKQGRVFLGLTSTKLG